MEIKDWVAKIIDGNGGLHDFQDCEMAIANIDGDQAVAGWTIRCLANPSCKSSREVLDAIVLQRKETCSWYLSPESTYYEAGCGSGYVINGTLLVEKYQYCPNCGKLIKECQYNDEDE